MIGVDILDIDRIKKMRSLPMFFERVFTDDEQKYISCKKGSHNFDAIAGLFCAKEAIAKALGTGFTKEIALKHIEILHTALGEPIVNLYEGAKRRLKELKKIDVKVTISHNGEYAVAFAMLV